MATESSMEITVGIVRDAIFDQTAINNALDAAQARVDIDRLFATLAFLRKSLRAVVRRSEGSSDVFDRGTARALYEATRVRRQPLLAEAYERWKKWKLGTKVDEVV